MNGTAQHMSGMVLRNNPECKCQPSNGLATLFAPKFTDKAEHVSIPMFPKMQFTMEFCVHYLLAPVLGQFYGKVLLNCWLHLTSPLNYIP